MPDDFENLGYLCVEEVVSIDRVRELIGQLDALSSEEHETRVRRGVSFARRNLLNLDFVAELAGDASIMSLVQRVAPGSIPVRAILFDKTGAANWTVPWHQDRSIAVHERVDAPGYGPWSSKAGVIHVQPPLAVLREMVTVRIHLDSCDAHNGPLRVVPRTHDRALDQRELTECTRSARPTTCVIGAGGVLIMRPLLLHASSPATRPGHRRVIHIEYGPATLPGGLNWAAKESAQPSVSQ